MNNSNCEILLVRHGQSLGNEKRVFLGHTDLDLSALGYEQAELCATALLGERIDAIYASDLLRAYNTAVPHARLRGMEITAREDLREIYAGDWENMLFEDIKSRFPEIYFGCWREHFASFSGAGESGESVPHLAERIYSAVVDIARKNLGKRVLIATHAAAIRALWGKLSGLSPDEASLAFDFPTNASITRVDFDGERLVPICYSDDSHLGSSADKLRNP